MAQVSYGTITITDTTDKNIFIRYSANADGSNSTSSPVSNTKYVGIYCGIAQTETEAMASSVGWTWSEYIGTDGVSVTSVTEIYQLRNDSATPTKRSDGTALPTAVDTVNTWSLKVPSYVSGGTYWTSTAVSMSEAPSPRYTTPVKNEALTDSSYNAAIANSIAQHANEDAQGAMSQAASNVNSVTRLWWSQATATPVPNISTIITDGAVNRRGAWSNIRPTDDEAYPYYFYCDQTITGGGVASWSTVTLDTSTLSKYEIIATNVRTQNFFKGKDSTYDGWFASGRSTDNGLKENDAETYFYNARFGATDIALGYNKTPVIHLDGDNGTINVYRLPTINTITHKVTTPGKLGAKLTASALNFYNASGTLTSSFGNSISLASNGATITIGSTSSGKYNTYIDTQGLYLRTGTTAYATLNGDGLELTKGGIKANTVGSDNGVYVSSENLGSVIPLVPTPSGSTNNKTDWRAVIGSKFGVDSEGNLYANNANISGKIIVTEGQIGGWNIGTDTNKSLFYGNQRPGAASNNLVISSSSVENTVSIAGSDINKHWFLSAGTKFGVDTEGNLYANNANLSNATVEGAIIANSLTINDNGSSYNAWDAINITGYSLDIEVDATGVSDIYNTTYLYPHLYHNGTEITLPSSATTAQKQEFYNKFLWYEGDSSTAVQGDYLNKGRILASYGDYWRVTYAFDDGATEGATPVQQVTVDPSTYITRIDDNTIKVHSKNWNTSTGFIQIDNQGNIVATNQIQSHDDIIATGQIYRENNVPLTSVQLVKW